MFKPKQSSSKRKKILRCQNDSSSDEEHNDEQPIFQKKKSKRFRSSSKIDNDKKDTENDEEEQGNAGTNQMLFKKDRKKKKSRRENRSSSDGGGGMSFSFKGGDDDDDDDSIIGEGDVGIGFRSSKKKKRKSDKPHHKKKSKRKGGLGFGGGASINDLSSRYLEEDDDEEEDYQGFGSANIKAMQPSSSMMHDEDEDMDRFGKYSSHTSSYQQSNNNNNATVSSMSGYGKEQLQMLKSQQKIFSNSAAAAETDTVVETTAKNDTATNMDTTITAKKNPDAIKQSISLSATIRSSSNGLPENNHGRKKNPFENGQDFISFNSTKVSPDTIIAGDDVLLYNQDEEEEEDDDEDGNSKHDKTTGQNESSNILNMASTDTNGNIHNEKDEETRRWEDEIARRAGVGDINPSSTTNTASATTATANRSISSSSTTINGSNPNTIKKSSTNIKNTIITAIQNMKVSTQDLESTISRRSYEHEMAKEEAKRKQDEMESIGSSFEYYQTLRLELSHHVCALRYLSQKITIIEQALYDFYEEAALKYLGRIQDWEDDVITTLIQHDWLDTTLGGRQSDSITDAKNGMNEVLTVDEFGRDKHCLVNLACNKRRNQRRQIYQRRHRSTTTIASSFENGDDNHPQSEKWTKDDTFQIVQSNLEESDGDISDNELMDREERRHALSDAVQVVLDEMDDEYSSPHKLIRLFLDWLKRSPEEYSQSFGSLTLVELLSVFVRADLCQKLDITGFIKHRPDNDNHFMNQFKWFHQLEELDKELGHDDKEKEHGGGDESQSTRHLIIKKVCYPMLLKIFRDEDSEGHLSSSIKFNPFSRKQSQVVFDFYKSIQTILQDDAALHPYSTKLNESILQYFKEYMKKNMVLPLLTRNSVDILHEGKEEKYEEHQIEAIAFAGFGQLYLLTKFISNIVRIWYPVMRGKVAKEMAQFCLIDLIADKFLRILSSLEVVKSKQKSKESEESIHFNQSKKIFKSVYETIEAAGWMESSDLMLFAAPLRAASIKIFQH